MGAWACAGDEYAGPARFYEDSDGPALTWPGGQQLTHEQGIGHPNGPDKAA